MGSLSNDAERRISMITDARIIEVLELKAEYVPQIVRFGAKFDGPTYLKQNKASKTNSIRN